MDEDSERVYPESWSIKRFSTLETFVAMSSAMGCGIAFGTFFSRTLTGRTWLLPGIVIGLVAGLCCTFFATPFFVVRIYEHRQKRRESRAKSRANHPAFRVWRNFPIQRDK